MPLGKEELNKLFCMYGKKYGLKKLMLKAVAIRESSLIETAYRYEPGFWQKYLKDNPEWKDKDPAVVSASYGLMQLMWTTAWSLGFRGTQNDLWNPVYNIELGAKLLKKLLDKVYSEKQYEKFPWLSPVDIVLARYNGGSYKNPDPNGNLRNQKYVTGVRKEWDNLCAKEKDCDDK